MLATVHLTEGHWSLIEEKCKPVSCGVGTSVGSGSTTGVGSEIQKFAIQCK